MNTEEKHAVIIGSGLGGLVCGYILAKNGLRVTVLEKDDQFGGCLQTFSRNGVRFETGMHYIGSMKEGQSLYNYFKYLSLLPDIKLSELDESGFDIISIAGRRFPIASGDEIFIDTLAREFPGHYSELRQYRNKIKEIVNYSPLYSFQFSKPITLLNPHSVCRSISGFLEHSTDDLLLQNVLAGNIPLYGGIYNKTPLYIYALIQDFYNNSAFRIVGGSDALAKSLVRSIRQMGGTVRNHSDVTEICCDDKHARSVLLSTGEVIEGNVFISDLHPARSLELLSTPLIREAYRKRIKSLQNTISTFTVYLQFKPNTVSYVNSNFYHYNCNSVWECEQYNESDWPKSLLYMHMCDEQNQRYAKSGVLITYMKYADVERWADTTVGNRGEDYLEFKQRKAERMIDEFEKQMPGTKQNILHYYTSTPLTYRDYTGTEKGSMYGLVRDYADPLRSFVAQRTKIPNVFFAGQNINSHGILGVIIGSIITCSEVVGMNTLVEQLKEIQIK